MSHHVNQIQSRIEQTRAAHAQLADDSDFDELLRIIHNPGWTSVAEASLVRGYLEAIELAATQIVTLRAALLVGARQVGLSENVPAGV